MRLATDLTRDKGLVETICPDNGARMGEQPDLHGRIACGTAVVPDLAASLADYIGPLGLHIVEDGPVSGALAAAWGTPASAGRRMVLLAPDSGTPGYLRLVEGTSVAAFRPARTWGWAAFEHSVADAFALHDAIGDGFEVLGPPRKVPGFDSFIPFQVAGRGGEILYLNQVLTPASDGLDLPPARARVDPMFIAVLAAPDRAASLAFHVDALGFETGATYAIPYGVIDRAFAHPPGTLTDMTMTRTGRRPATEIDQYPAAASVRPCAFGELPPGNAIVSFIVADLAKVRAPFVAPPAVQPGALYAGCRSACVVGAAGELIELIEA